MAAVVAEEYLSSLTDLTINSKPLINMLTMLAEENQEHAPAIVGAIESHIEKVAPQVKLPVLYLIDSIVKNVSAVYVPLFTANIVQIFASVFEKVDEKTRMSMFKLRQTWNDIFPAMKMYTLDLRIQHMDQNWPTLSPPPTSIHFNPKFLGKTVGKVDGGGKYTASATSDTVSSSSSVAAPSSDAATTLIKKQQILMELQQKKRQLELIQQKVMFGDQLPSAVVQPIINEDLTKTLQARGINMPKIAPRGVVIPSSGSSAQSTGQPGNTKTKISAPSSLLIEAAKSRDPRLARRANQQAPSKAESPKKKKTSPQKNSDSEADLLEELLRQQKAQAAKLAQAAAKAPENKTPEAKVAADEIENRQMAMLKAPVLGQLNRKSSDNTNKSKRRRSPPPQPKDPRRREPPKQEYKPSPESPKSYKDKSHRKSRDRPRNSSSKTEENRKRDRRNRTERKEERVQKPVEPTFSPEPPSEDPYEYLPPRPVKDILPPSPPPPPMIGTDATEEDSDVVEEKKSSPPVPRKEPLTFKQVKGALTRRNYSRRNKERSLSPISDVDIRVVAVEEDLPGQNLVSGLVTEELVDVGKDVDLRLLAAPIASPKKRHSTDDLDSPSHKRGKTDADTIQLFGNMDMDERMPIAPRGPPPGSPPPPPKISSSPTPNSNADAVESSEWAEPRASPKVQINKPLENKENQIEENDVKRRIPPPSPGAGERDRLGRLLLYKQLPSDPMARRESLHHHSPRRDSAELQENLHVDDILAQAKEQLARGTMTPNQYNELMAKIVQMNEDQKIRDAQRQRRQFNKSPPFDGPGRQNFRQNGPWRGRSEEEPFMRRSRGGRRGGPRGRGGNPVWQESRFHGRNSPDWKDHDSRSQESWPMAPDLSSLPLIPPTDPALVDTIEHPLRYFTIDGTPRVIRFYGNQAVVLLSHNNAREIFFENGTRRIFIAGMEVPCQLNGTPMSFPFKNRNHVVRIGYPTREVNIDEKYYEVHFGGPPIATDLDGFPCTLELEGPPPLVRFAPQGNSFCLGSVLLIVDARSSFHIFLDAKLQRFEINGRPLVFKFQNGLSLVLINGVPVPLRFGGNPVPINYNDEQHFLRLTELPAGLAVGRVSILGMERLTEDGLVHNDNSNSMDVDVPAEIPMEVNEPPGFNGGMYMDLVSSTMGEQMQPDKNVSFNYQCEPDAAIVKQETVGHVIPDTSIPPPGAGLVAPSFLQVNINDLFKSLVATGIITKNEPGKMESEAIPDRPMPKIKHVDFDDTKSMKESQPGLVQLLYSGIQCGSCGVRFSSAETEKYSQHLDWHFRQNRRDRDAARRGSSRRWYYDVSDWIQFEEIEDLEERAQSWFETEAMKEGDDTVEEEVHSVPAPPGGVSIVCHVCRDKFDTFYHEETEEWHLRHCIFDRDDYYHPTCHRDAMKPSPEPIMSLPLLEPLKEEPPPPVEESIVVLDDDDDHDPGDIQVVTADEEAVETLVKLMVERVIMMEECERSPIEDDELEVLAVTNKDENKAPADLIDISEPREDDIIYYPPSPGHFDPNKKIKEEPMDEMEKAVAQVDQTIANVTTSIDGNVEMADTAAAPAVAPSRIKITFSKPLTTPQVAAPEPATTVQEEEIDPSELQIEEQIPEPLVAKSIKPRIAERNLTVYPPCEKGTEISGLCSIM